MSLTITQLIAALALGVSIYSAWRAHKVSEAQMILPRRLRQQAYRDELRKDASQALLDLEPFTSRVRSGDLPDVPESILNLRRSGQLRAKPLGPVGESNVGLCCTRLHAIEIHLQIALGAQTERNYKRSEVADTVERAQENPKNIEVLRHAADDASEYLLTKRNALLEILDVAKKGLEEVIDFFDRIEAREFPERAS